MARYIAPRARASGGALFCDRDGVLNRRNPEGYVTTPDQFELLELALPALRQATRDGVPVVVVSNQGAIARGLASSEEVLLVNAWMLNRLTERGIEVDAIYVCPHHPIAIDPSDRRCACRKPAPGLFLAAAADLAIDLSRSLMLGDQPSDVAAAVAAGIPVARALTVTGDEDPLDVSAAVTAAFG